MTNFAVLQLRCEELEDKLSVLEKFNVTRKARIIDLEHDLLRAAGRERDLEEKLKAAELALWDYQNLEEDVCPGKTIKEHIEDLENVGKIEYLDGVSDAEDYVKHITKGVVSKTVAAELDNAFWILWNNKK